MQSLKKHIYEGLLAGQDATLNRGQADLDAMAIQDIEKKLSDPNRYFIHSPRKDTKTYDIKKVGGKWVVDIYGNLTVFGEDEAVTDGSFSFRTIQGQYVISLGYDNTKFKSLQYGPKVVYDNFLIYWGDNLKDLQHCPKIIGNDFEIGGSGIETLKYFPSSVGRNVRICDNMKLKDFSKIGKSRVKGRVRIAHNGATTTEVIAKNIIDKWNIDRGHEMTSLFDYNVYDYRQLN